MTQHGTSPIGVGMDVHQSSITAAIVRKGQEPPEVVHLPGDLCAEPDPAPAGGPAQG